MTVGEKLRWLRDRLSDYPIRDDVVSFADKPYTTGSMSFFPSDLGVYNADRERLSTIVLGSDWGNEESFLRALATPQGRYNKTVAETDKLLGDAGFDLEDCLYSNAWPLMRRGNAAETVDHPMRSDIELTNAYRDFLKLCIETLEAKLIIALGIAPAWFVGPLIGSGWRCGVKSLARLRTADLDTEPTQISSGLVFVAVTHPSHPQNRKHRRFSVEDVNEVGLITRARRMAGIPNL